METTAALDVVATVFNMFEVQTKLRRRMINITSNLTIDEIRSRDKIILIGPSRTGKSYIARRLARNPNEFPSLVSNKPVTPGFIVDRSIWDDGLLIVDSRGLDNTKDPLDALSALDELDPRSLGIRVTLVIVVYDPDGLSTEELKKKNIRDLVHKLFLDTIPNNLLFLASAKGNIIDYRFDQTNENFLRAKDNLRQSLSSEIKQLSFNFKWDLLQKDDFPRMIIDPIISDDEKGDIIYSENQGYIIKGDLSMSHKITKFMFKFEALPVNLRYDYDCMEKIECVRCCCLKLI